MYIHRHHPFVSIICPLHSHLFDINQSFLFLIDQAQIPATQAATFGRPQMLSPRHGHRPAASEPHHAQLGLSVGVTQLAAPKANLGTKKTGRSPEIPGK